MSNKSVFLLIPIISLLAASCSQKPSTSIPSQNNNTVSEPTQNQLQETYTNNKYGYEINYPSGYQAQTFQTTDAGYDLPKTPATSDSDTVVINKEGLVTSVTVSARQSQTLPSEASIKSGFAVQPESMTSIQMSGMTGYKIVFPASANIPYIEYYLQNSQKAMRYEIKVVANDELSNIIFQSFRLH